MRKVIFPIAFIGTTTLLACSFNMKAGGADDPNNQVDGGPPPPTQSAATPAGTTVKPSGLKPTKALGKAQRPTPTPSGSTTPAPTPSTPPSGAPIVNAATIFGSGTIDPAGYKGSIFFVAAGTTKVPTNLASTQPNGFLFTKDINVTPQAFTTGFPGVDAAKKENFVIRYEAPLQIGSTVPAGYDIDFRLVADDGAILSIDGTPIVDNDGVKAAPAEKTGPVHLNPGVHSITVDYLQTSGNVAIQVFCKKTGEATDKACPLTWP